MEKSYHTSAVGIDLGTKFIKVARVDKGTVDILIDGSGAR